MHFTKIIALLFISSGLFAQQNTIVVLDSGQETSLRGLSVVNDNVLWASGSNGTVARSTNGGKTFEWLTVQGYEQRDFRDVEAFDENTALIMAIAEPAVILKTKDGGKNWYKVFEDTTKGMFLDAMDFDGVGAVIGDPINGIAFFAMTLDDGETWYANKFMKVSLSEGEAFFAASGSNIKFVRHGDVSFPIFVTGGKKSRMIIAGKPFELNILQGSESQGANSISIYTNKTGVIVGGDFKNDTISQDNCVIIRFQIDSVPNFIVPQTPPHGYRSCVAYITENKLITCGTSGVDISNDSGMNWELISTRSFHVCQKAKNGIAVFLAGANGKIAKLEVTR
jgi:hypothetical protein